ncbi:MAG: hypothetical protein V1668_04225 [Patescibacteria group bacterium]
MKCWEYYFMLSGIVTGCFVNKFHQEYAAWAEACFGPHSQDNNLLSEEHLKEFTMEVIWKKVLQSELDNLNNPAAEALWKALLECPAGLLYIIPEEGNDIPWDDYLDEMRQAVLVRLVARMRQQKLQEPEKTWIEILQDQLRIIFFRAYHRIFDDIISQERRKFTNDIMLGGFIRIV